MLLALNCVEYCIEWIILYELDLPKFDWINSSPVYKNSHLIKVTENQQRIKMKLWGFFMSNLHSCWLLVLYLNSTSRPDCKKFVLPGFLAVCWFPTGKGVLRFLPKNLPSFGSLLLVYFEVSSISIHLNFNFIRLPDFAICSCHLS